MFLCLHHYDQQIKTPEWNNFGPGRSSEDIKKEHNVNCFYFFFFSVSLLDVMGGKITLNLKELH